MRARHSLAMALPLLAGCLGAQNADVQRPPPSYAKGPIPFEAVQLHQAVEKVKYVVNGQPVTTEELSQVRAAPAALGDLVATWLQTPEAEPKLMAFFTNAFQQRFFGLDELVDQLGNNRVRNDARLVANVRELFPRTVLRLVSEDRPFTETVTGRTFSLTPALAALLAAIDARHVDDAFRPTERMGTLFGVSRITIQTHTAVPLSQTLDPASPNFLVFHVAAFPNCPTSATDSTPRTERVLTRNLPLDLFDLLNGEVPDDPNRAGLAADECQQFRFTGALTDADFTTWRPVRIRRPASGEIPTGPFDLNAFRSAPELVLNVPRVGFFSTLAFFANWATNDSNQSRVLANQALIVGLNHSIESTDTTVPLSEPALDNEHASDAVCYGCHRTLDPMRQVFRRVYTLGYHEQLDATQRQTESVFTFGGVSAVTNDLPSYAAVIVDHPLYALAWAQKLCAYANSAPCSPDDPELARVAQAFRDSGFNFKTLVRELFASPLVTGLSETKTLTDRGEVLSISRRDHLCSALATRLRLANPCAATTVAARISVTFPEDGYSRGSEVPLTISDTSLFFRSGTENLCMQLAPRVVDGTSARFFSGAAARDQSFDDLVHQLMGLPPGDPRAAPSRAVLVEHFQAALAQTGRATDAMRSTFVLACTSPAVTAIGL